MYDKALNHAYETIGNTPMVRLSRMTEGLDGHIYAKLEYLNPGFSKKDRAALQMIIEGEQSGALVPGQTVIELTSGNTGTGLAIVCAGKGYPFIAVMSKGNSPERASMMKALGAEVVLVDQAPGSVPGQVSGQDLALVEETVRRLTVERQAFRADQFNRWGNVHAHQFFTAEEMWNQTEGNIDVFVDFAGSGGTFAGCAKGLKKHKPSIRCYLVEPETAPYLAGKPVTNPGHRIQGAGYSMDLPFLREPELIEDYLQVSDGEAIQAARDLARKEGIFAGFSSGANVAAALKLLQGKERGSNIVLTINDSGLKYLSTDLFE
ncbi:pyridoxal-phosphate dependent enzyme [Cohnella sp. CFH 77786]|uniref:PLP-dependent cysteine synthase family protein n=1 Tax=Cohnella sp. CFH 77786 TaxID=2662265 RepID=UPI001C60A466|nr:cysteine synthase family protein [Cohnella sp. CFH 77786]MBW5447721.1 pyridoxal-phosphate dependent enzyme [Cohnella sp. CFH 77786]